MAEIPELLARFGRPRSVSVGPQSEIDVWEQLDYREERRRQRSNSIGSNFSAINENHSHSISEEPYTNGRLLDDISDEKLLRTSIEESRKPYDVEVVTKLIVYGGIVIQRRFLIPGIGCLSVDFLPVAFHALGLSVGSIE